MPCDHTYTVLYRHDGLTVGDYRCRARRGQPSPEEQTSRDMIVFVRRGLFEKQVGTRTTLATTGHVLFYRAGEVHRTRHPVDHGDDCTVLALEARLLHELRGELSGGGWKEQSTLPASWPSTGGLHLRHRMLARRLATSSMDPLEAHEELLAVAADALIASSAIGRTGEMRRRATIKAHRDLTHGVTMLLAASPEQRWALDVLARNVHSSPFHLSRVFKREMGMPIHRFLTRLRLREAMDRLGGRDGDDLTALALDLGFSSRGHFSDAFRREFGVAPAVVRAQLRGRGGDEVSGRRARSRR